MPTHSSEEWTKAHIQVNDNLNRLLGALRDYGYNPNLHISYDREEHHLQVDPAILNKHPDIKMLFLDYLSACRERDAALDKIQQLPKMDLGFQQQP
ncbi:hypothetical protein FY534_10410 [Alicyclobacillus sp. TC]|nr:hypothetical protein [Alicyclobacillus montanus]QRF24743.1 hypothetical protein FY534_10410 [Alicyclobacillus sp. TC]